MRYLKQTTITDQTSAGRDYSETYLLMTYADISGSRDFFRCLYSSISLTFKNPT